MKKKYIHPEILVVNFQYEGVLMAGSSMVIDPNIPGTPAAPSRRQNIWDEYERN